MADKDIRNCASIASYDSANDKILCYDDSGNVMGFITHAQLLTALQTILANKSITLTAGDGLSGGGDLSANRSFAIDSTVIRTTGPQNLADVKTFTSFPVTPSSAPTTDYQTANKKYVDDSTSTIANVRYTSVSTSLLESEILADFPDDGYYNMNGAVITTGGPPDRYAICGFQVSGSAVTLHYNALNSDVANGTLGIPTGVTWTVVDLFAIKDA